MNYEKWQEIMLAKGYQKFFLGDFAKGSIALFAESLRKLASLLSSDNKAVAEEANELKGLAIKYGVKPILDIVDDFEKLHEQKDFDQCRALIKKLALIVKDFKQMLIQNCP